MDRRLTPDPLDVASPPARNPTTRPGRNIRLNRDANIEANLAQITGEVNTPVCAHCAGSKLSISGWTVLSCSTANSIIKASRD